MTPIAPKAQPGSSTPDAAVEPLDTNLEHVLPADIAASELLVQLGYEYFAIGGEASNSEPNAAHRPDGNRTIDPQQLATASAPGSMERDFWEDVAVATEKASHLPHHSSSSPNDTLAYAIATVSASYTLPSSERRATPTTAGAANAPSAGAPTAAPKAPLRSDQGNDLHVNNQPADLFEALASLLSFEDVAGLADVREIDPAVFQQARELAAAALVATETNRNSALKAAEGRRG